MIRFLCDTNVVLDFLLRREPWIVEARQLWRAHRENRIEACITATTLTDVFYVSRRQIGIDMAWRSIHACLDTLPIIPVDQAVLRNASALSGRDFEDNIQIVGAMAFDVDFIVTRDVSGFIDSPIPVVTPAVFLAENCSP